MKIIRKTLLTLLLLICSAPIFAQDIKMQAKALIKQGITLNDAGKFTEAIQKYDEALKLDPENLSAQYEKGYTLVVSGKGAEAISVLEKVVATNTVPEAYDLLAGLYDDKGDFKKALAYYKQGIIAFPQFQQLKLNLSIAYSRQQKYDDAEQLAIEAIKLNPKHASSHRAYALATLGGDKKAASILGWCSFLMLEPNTRRSAEGISFLTRILNSGIKKNADGSTNMSLVSTPSASQDLMIQIAVAAATTDKKGLTPVDSLQLQLKSVFSVLSEQSAKDASSFQKKYMADYFGAMATSGNMPTFAHYITLATNTAEDKIWLGAHPEEIKKFTDWVDATKRELE